MPGIVLLDLSILRFFIILLFYYLFDILHGQVVSISPLSLSFLNSHALIKAHVDYPRFPANEPLRICTQISNMIDSYPVT